MRLFQPHSLYLAGEYIYSYTEFIFSDIPKALIVCGYKPKKQHPCTAQFKSFKPSAITPITIGLNVQIDNFPQS